MESDKKRITDPFAADTLSSETVMAFSRDDLVELLLRLNERLAEQDKEIAELRKLIDKLKSELAKANKNSSTPSKPPSSNIVKPPRLPMLGR